MPESTEPKDAGCTDGSCSPNQYRYGIGFCVWLTCNAQCSHCLTNSSPRSREALDVEVIKRCLREAAALGIRGYQVTGGEPTIFMGKLLDIFGCGHSLGMTAAMTTNAQFATSRERARGVLRQLKDVGLDCVRVSTDVYHDPYIPFERVLTVVEVAIEEGLETAIELVMVRKDPDLGETFKALQKLSPPAHLFINGTLPTGTAKGLPSEVFLTRAVGEFRNAGCVQAKSLFIDTDGRAYYCCNFPRGFPGEERDDTSLYCIGNVHEHSVATILDNMQKSAISQVLFDKGPNGLLQILRDRYGAEEIDRLHNPQRRYCGLCDFCYSVAGNPALIPLIAESTGCAGHPDYDGDPEAVIAQKRYLQMQREAKPVSPLRVVS